MARGWLKKGDNRKHGSDGVAVERDRNGGVPRHERKMSMNRSSICKTVMAVGIALAVSMWNGAAEADQEFHTLVGVSATALSQNEMAAVEGKDALGFVFPEKAGGDLFKVVKSKKDGPLLLFDTQSVAVGLLDPKAGILSVPSSSSKNPLMLLDLGLGSNLLP
jgi:hypothetical protein